MRCQWTIGAVVGLLLAGCGGGNDDAKHVAGQPVGTQTGGGQATTAKPGGRKAAGTAPQKKVGSGQPTAASGASTQAALKARFIASADPICRDYNAHLVPVLKAFGAASGRSPADRASVAAALDRAYPALRADQLKIYDLKRPRDPALEAYVSSLYQRVALVPKLAGAIRANNRGELVRVGLRAKALIQSSTRFARRYGFKECGRI
jgi:hypothetical protein